MLFNWHQGVRQFEAVPLRPFHAAHAGRGPLRGDERRDGGSGPDSSDQGGSSIDSNRVLGHFSGCFSACFLPY